MSCRVLKKGVENYTIEQIVDIAKKRGCSKVFGEFIPTKKNSMVSELYAAFGFELTNDNKVLKQYVLTKEHMADYKQKYYFEEL